MEKRRSAKGSVLEGSVKWSNGQMVKWSNGQMVKQLVTPRRLRLTLIDLCNGGLFQIQWIDPLGPERVNTE